MSDGRLLTNAENDIWNRERARIFKLHQALLERGYHHANIPAVCDWNVSDDDIDLYEWLAEPERDIMILPHIFVNGDRWTPGPTFVYADMVYLSSDDFLLFKLRWM